MDLRAAMGDAPRAAALAREALEADPSNARARAYLQAGSLRARCRRRVAQPLGNCSSGSKQDFVASALAYRAALLLDPADADALNNLGWTIGKARLLRPGGSSARAGPRHPTRLHARAQQPRLGEEPAQVKSPGPCPVCGGQRLDPPLVLPGLRIFACRACGHREAIHDAEPDTVATTTANTTRARSSMRSG